MDNRSFNIFFHLHTVSGIVISVLLYVIFFAGSFSFFKDEIITWEQADTKHELNLTIDAALDSLGKATPLFGRDISFYGETDERRIGVNISDSRDTVNRKTNTAGRYFYLDSETFKQYSYEESYSLGEFLYRLHFFAQIPYPAGYYLSGFTALFFLFAIITGVLVHWKKIITNFFLFRPWEKLKTVWTDAHTVLGTIGLPFQVVYAVTGAFFMINIVFLAPTVAALYDGDQTKLFNELGYSSPTYTFENAKLERHVPINSFVLEVKNKWRDFDVNEVTIYNYGDSGMHVRIAGDLKTSVKFTGHGGVIYKAISKEIVHTTDPYGKASYLGGVKNILYRAHYGSYGGYPVKVVSFLMGMLTCFVIITGILVWLEARNKKHIPEKRKRFNKTVGHIYLAICLTMYPVTALSFIVTKLVPHDYDPQRQTILYSFFFLSWLALSIFFWLKRDNYFTCRYTLLSGGVVGLLIPFVNSIARPRYELVTIDLLWIFVSITTLYAVYGMKAPGKNTATILRS